MADILGPEHTAHEDQLNAALDQTLNGLLDLMKAGFRNGGTHTEVSVAVRQELEGRTYEAPMLEALLGRALKRIITG